ncbi:MAG TPA: toll/interleukin-1 receptor domain-containing protein [Thermoanaerobaculia bacterium]|nr:toll/interleukin-1 receptor domain-containing protein [Thermoanaerobaculia bacterium]
MAAGKIFVCYRREDSAGHAGRLYDRLNQRFPGRVFMDVAGIGVGTRWAEVVEQTLGSCEVAVILIGRRWLERNPAGARRIDDKEDSLRAEITTALRLKLKVIPLLVAGAAVPESHDLPTDVAPIVDWQALRIDDDDFDHDSSRLIGALERQLQDEGTDPHLESAEAKQSEIRRLMANAESCIARGDWVTAAQTLLAVLSLDKANAEAATRLRFVQEQSARAYKPELPPSSSKGRPGRWAAFGILGILGAIGAATVAVILIALIVLANKGSSNVNTGPNTNTGTPPSASNAANPAGDKPAAMPQEPAAPQLAGDYELTSYAMQGMVIPLSGGMRLVPIGDGRFQFETSVTHQLSGAVFQYRGFFEGQGSHWTTTTMQTNDPSAVTGPIPTQVRFDGSTLMTQNSYGQLAVWQKR